MKDDYSTTNSHNLTGVRQKESKADTQAERQKDRQTDGEREAGLPAAPPSSSSQIGLDLDLEDDREDDLNRQNVQHREYETNRKRLGPSHLSQGILGSLQGGKRPSEISFKFSDLVRLFSRITATTSTVTIPNSLHWNVHVRTSSSENVSVPSWVNKVLYSFYGSRSMCFYPFWSGERRVTPGFWGRIPPPPPPRPSLKPNLNPNPNPNPEPNPGEGRHVSRNLDWFQITKTLKTGEGKERS